MPRFLFIFIRDSMDLATKGIREKRERERERDRGIGCQRLPVNIERGVSFEFTNSKKEEALVRISCEF